MAMAENARREALKSALLAVLVGLSLVLVALIWAEAPGSGQPRRPQPYVADGASAKAEPAELFAPWRLVIRVEGKPFLLSRASGLAYRLVWQAAVAELEPVAMRVLEGPVMVTPRQASDLAHGATGLEVKLPGTLPFGDWLALWGQRERTGAGREGFPGAVLAEAVDRLVMIPDQGRLTVLLGGKDVWRRLTLQGGGRLARALSAADTGVAARELRSGEQGLRVLPGVFVPASPGEFGDLGVVPARGEDLIRHRLAAALFPNAAVVRQVEGRQGQILLTDGERSLLVSRDGSLAYTWPGTPRSRRVRVPAELAAAAVDFIGSAGGWPGGSGLLHVEQVTEGGTWLLSLEFTSAVGGLPVLNLPQAGLPVLNVPASPGVAERAPGISGALKVLLTQAGSVRSYGRTVRVANGRPQVSGSVLSPEAALASLRRFAAVGARDGGLSVRDMYLGYCAVPSGEGRFQLRPVWVVELTGGSTGLVRRAVDATPDAGGRVYGDGDIQASERGGEASGLGPRQGDAAGGIPGVGHIPGL